MTVAELIRDLSVYPSEAKVVRLGDDCEMECVGNGHRVNWVDGKATAGVVKLEFENDPEND